MIFTALTANETQYFGVFRLNKQIIYLCLYLCASGQTINIKYEDYTAAGD